MMWKIILALTGIFAGLIGFSIYQSSGSITSALILILLLALLIYSVRSWEVLWESITLLQNPYIIAFLFLSAGFYIYSVYGNPFWPSTYFSTGLALVGFAVGILVYSYWNIA